MNIIVSIMDGLSKQGYVWVSKSFDEALIDVSDSWVSVVRFPTETVETILFLV